MKNETTSTATDAAATEQNAQTEALDTQVAELEKQAEQMREEHAAEAEVKGDNSSPEEVSTEAPASEQEAKATDEAQSVQLSSDTEPGEPTQAQTETSPEEQVKVSEAAVSQEVITVAQVVPSDKITKALKSAQLKSDVVIFLCVLLLIAFSALVYFYQGLSRSVSEVERAGAASEQLALRLDEAVKAVDAGQSQVTELIAQNQKLQQDNATLSAQIDELKSTFSTDSNSLTAITERLERFELRNPNDWLLAQSYFLINNAYQMSLFAQDFSSAVWCLKQANELLADIEDEEIIAIRSAISDDVMLLESQKNVDRRGINFKIDSVYKMVPSLVFSEFSSNTERAAGYSKGNTDAADEISNWQNNLMQSLLDFSSRFIEVKRRGDTVLNSFISPEQGTILRQNIQSALLQAKFSLNHADQSGYEDSLKMASDMISGFFATDNEVTVATLKALGELSGERIEVTRPNVLSSFTLFQDLVKDRKLEFIKVFAAGEK